MARDLSAGGWASFLRREAIRVAAAALILGAILAALPLENVGGDFVCFWSAGRLLGQGRDPYDGALQAALQRPLGWDRATSGIGLYDFMPYYYPPWFTLLCLPFGALPYVVGKVLWLYLTIWLLLASGGLLGRILELPARDRLALSAVTVGFALSAFSILFAQTSPLVLFLIACLWWAIRGGRDRLAGVILAWLTIKPQLTAVLVGAALLWAWRANRPRLIAWAGATLLVLIGLSTALQPDWVVSFLQATRKNPVLTETYPWLGSTWMLALRVAGLGGASLWILDLAAVLPILAWVLRGTRPGGDGDGVVAWLAPALIAAFFVAPYAQPYDFTVLLPVVAWIAHRRVESRRRNLILLATLSLPYLHVAFGETLVRLLWERPPAQPARVLLFWFPVALLLTWAWTGRRREVGASASTLR